MFKRAARVLRRGRQTRHDVLAEPRDPRSGLPVVETPPTIEAPIDPNRIVDVVVREPGRWSRTPIGVRDILTVPYETIRSLGALSPRTPPLAVSIADQDVIEPVTPLVLACTRERIAVAAPGSDVIIPLSTSELDLLEVLDGPAALATLASRAGLDPGSASAIASRLAELGCLRCSGSAPGLPPPDPPEPPATSEEPRPVGSGSLRPLDPARIPVVPVHQPRFGPPLALGSIMAYARIWEDGRLSDRFDLRSPVTVDEARALLGDHRGPAVLLCSDYVWSYRANLQLAEELADANPQLVVVHGGPHTPKYEGDQERFFQSPGVHVAVLGEGELTAVELLEALGSADRFGDLEVLAFVAGVVFRGPSGDLIRTGDRERIDDLSILPSPYLSGEFDDLHPGSWSPAIGAVATTETNRGCPYKCAFCDWGSATMSRIRKFPLDRVLAEFDWLAERGHEIWMVADANYGILPRDVEIVDHLVDLHEKYGVPTVWGVNTAKNATRNLSRIIAKLCDEGITVVSSLSLQTRDAGTLAAIDRSNISSKRYDDLALAFRRERLPILCDLILGLPGATSESFKSDLQWCVDHEITPRVWVCQVLPNAPMNDPEYRERFGLELDADDVVVASTTFTRQQREHMMGLRAAERIFEHHGLLRHVLRYLQWDHGLPAVDVLDRLVEVTGAEPGRYPLLSWAQHHLDGLLVPPVAWIPFYDDVARFVRDEFGIEQDSGLDTVIAVQLALMPDRSRAFPAVAELPHDYVAYYLGATSALRRLGHAGTPLRPLQEHGPGVLEVTGDPALLGQSFRRLYEERPPDLLPGAFWHVTHFELDSALTRWVNEVRATEGYSPPEWEELRPEVAWPGEEPCGAAPVALAGRMPTEGSAVAGASSGTLGEPSETER